MKAAAQAFLSFSSLLPLITFPYLTHASYNAAHLAHVAPMGELNLDDTIGSALPNGCPQPCTVAGPDPGNWTWIPELRKLSRCQQPLLFDLHIGNEPTSDTPLRSCVVSEHFQDDQIPNFKDANWANVDQEDLDAVQQSLTIANSCGASQQNTTASVQISSSGAVESRDDTTDALNILVSYMSNAASCGSTIIFSKVGNTVAALYAGADVYQRSVGPFLDSFAEDIASGSQTIQACREESKMDKIIGLRIIDSVEKIADAYTALKAWAEGSCLSLDKQTSVKKEVTTLGVSSKDKRSLVSSLLDSPLTARANCRTVKVVGGDGCGSLASRCKISAQDLSKYNAASNFCSSLKVDQLVCCSAGTLPDNRPKPQADGVCAHYSIKPKDVCADLAKKFSITVEDINTFNKNSWGWAGCGNLKEDQVICLSKGNTPMPAALTGATCGPQKPGTKAPSGSYDGWDLVKINPCPLNACCSGWGYCGTTEEFCTESPADTKAPGAFQKNKNGCISNCGTDVINNKETPDTFIRVAYYEAFNVKRDCLNMNVKEIDDDTLTHVHFAFAGVSADFDITFDSAFSDQFDNFVQMKAPWKKVLSFGGWAESTDAGTFQRYKDVVKSGNREKFAKNLAAFLEKHELDGIDFDWEYPGATDIPGVPNTAGETSDYLEFLKLMKTTLGSKSLSIALPASYWYLKAFPVAKMAPYLTYFIYMTYDLHGQWDHGSAFADVGCPAGNCLRSHVNKTETYNSLAMITKAGVPAAKVVVGVASYGRSFGMTDPSCTGPMCTYTGTRNHSTAEKGMCTDTAGYISNAELNDMIGVPQYQVRSWYDKESDSDMMVFGYDGAVTTWVAYMSHETKMNRIEWILSLNFGGATDWAIDLEDWHEGIDPDSQDAVDLDAAIPPSCPSNHWPGNLDDLEVMVDNGDIDVECQSQAVVSILLRMVEPAIKAYQEAADNMDDYFTYYAEWVKNDIDDSLLKFMWSDGMKYMDCKWDAKGSSGGEGSGACTEMHVKQGQPDQGTVTITYTMREEEAFYKALMDQYGISKDWIYWKDIWSDSEGKQCHCPNLKHDCPECRQEPDIEVYHNFPRKLDDDEIEVANPKEIIEAAIPNITYLSTSMVGTFIQMRMGGLDVSDQDVATSYSMPVFLLGDVTEQMEQITEIGKKQKEADKKERINFILNIVSMVLVVIPFAGEATAAIGGATAIARAAAVVGEVSNAAVTIAEIVNEPKSAPFAILGFLMGSSTAGVVGKGTKNAFTKAAGARKAMTADTLKAFSPSFQKNDAIVQKIVQKCLARG
ncbi:CAZyme family GH18 [Penicillium angulare]|uniref:CAZyme family GH18 n=1 Tax=Penicillium angulare TaxID=116970 RepID=UPI0025404A3C|nr:CAZyme family GH18 [Penicillium angulare]KAJ5256981.1 CAZyme family GH18 [Penicillium angulare]